MRRAGSIPRRWATAASSSGAREASMAEGRGGSFSRNVRRISSMPDLHQLLAVERGVAGQQLVEQHAQAVNVAARVNVHPSICACSGLI